MKTVFGASCSKYILAMSVGLVLFSVANLTFAAEPNGRYGWFDPATEIGAVDTSCGANMNRLELVVRERGTNSLASVGSGGTVFLAVIDRSTNQAVYSMTGAGPVVGSLCYNPDVHYLGVDIAGGASFHDYWGTHSMSNPGSVPRGRIMQATVWLTRTSETLPEYQQVYPSPDVITKASSSPNYVLAANYLPSVYGVSGFSRAEYYVVTYDPVSEAYDYSDITYRSETISGGVGEKTLPAVPLSDGWYGWGFYLRANANHDAGSGYIGEEVPVSSFSDVWAPFIVDTTPPTVSTGHAPTEPTEDESVTVTVTASDELAGVTHIAVYFNDNLEQTCTFAAVNTGQCEVSVGFLTPGTHSYTVQAKDDVGNVISTAPMTVIVTAVASPVADLSADTPTVSETSVMPGETVTFSTGNIQNIGSAAAQAHTWSGFEIYIDGDDTAPEYTTPGGSYDFTLPAGGSYASSTDWTVPANAPTGNYRVRYTVDTGNVNESPSSATWSNNVSSWATFEIGSSPSGFITADGCTVPIGQATCAVELEWGSSNLVGSASVRHDGVVFHTSDSMTAYEREANPGADNQFTIHDTGSGILNGVIVPVECANGSTWNGSVCEAETTTGSSCDSDEFYNTYEAACVPNIALTAPTEVWTRSQRPKDLTYTVGAPYRVDCTILDGTMSNIIQEHTGTLTNAEQDHTHTVRPLKFTQLVYISCEAPGMPEPVTRIARVQVVPEIEEI